MYLIFREIYCSLFFLLPIKIYTMHDASSDVASCIYEAGTNYFHWDELILLSTVASIFVHFCSILLIGGRLLLSSCVHYSGQDRVFIRLLLSCHCSFKLIFSFSCTYKITCIIVYLNVK